MSFDINPAFGSANLQGVRQAEKKKFEEEKAAALSAAKGNSYLTNRINGITEHKGAIQELEALLMEATKTQNSTPPNRTLGIG